MTKWIKDTQLQDDLSHGEDWFIWIKRKTHPDVTPDFMSLQFSSNGSIKTKDRAEQIVDAVIKGLNELND